MFNLFLCVIIINLKNYYKLKCLQQILFYKCCFFYQIAYSVLSNVYTNNTFYKKYRLIDANVIFYLFTNIYSFGVVETILVIRL